MSSASGRYQSRLFNFFHQQTQRLTQQCDQLVRHLQFTTSSVAAVVLYPFYLLFQSTRDSTKQFHQVADDTNSQPSIPPTADTPIGRVLLLVNEAQSEEAISTLTSAKPKSLNPLALLANLRFKFANTSTFETLSTTSVQESEVRSQELLTPQTLRLNRPRIRGIATQLSNRTLVLVTGQNEILDVLTQGQQEKIQQLIIEEVAQYWRYQRILHSVRQKFTTQLHGSQESEVRRTWETKETRKTWGTRKNLNLSSPSATLPLLPRPSSQALVFLDRVVAELESKNLTPVSKAAITLSHRSRELIQWVQTKASTSLSKKESSAIADDQVETQTIRIQSLIWAAVNYFFGDRFPRKHLDVTTPPANSLSGKFNQNLPGISDSKSTKSKPRRLAANLPFSSQSVSVGIDDLWLTLSDLFGDSDEVSKSTSQQSELSNSQTISAGTNKKNNKALAANQSAGYFLQNLVNRFQKFSPQSKPAFGLIKRQKTTKGELQGKVSSNRSDETKSGLMPGSPSPVKPTCGISTGEMPKQIQSQSTQVEPAPDWIEINATTMGYIKHPLEQLLEWLDRSMLWLEELLVKIWQWVQRWWRGK